MSPARSQKPANLNEGQRRRGAGGSSSARALREELPNAGCGVCLLGRCLRALAPRLGISDTSSLGLVAVDQGVDDPGDDGLLVFIEDSRGVGNIGQGGMIALVVIEEELVGRDAQSHTQPPEHVQARRRQPGLVTTELGEMDACDVGQLALGETTGGPENAESLGEFHQLYSFASSIIADHRIGNWRASCGGKVMNSAGGQPGGRNARRVEPYSRPAISAYRAQSGRRSL